MISDGVFSGSMFSPAQMPHWLMVMSRKSSHASASRCLSSFGVIFSPSLASAVGVSMKIGPRPAIISSSMMWLRRQVPGTPMPYLPNRFSSLMMSPRMVPKSSPAPFISLP